MIQVTLSFPSIAEASAALYRLAGEPVSATLTQIAPADRPDVGLAVPLPPEAALEQNAADVGLADVFNPFAAAAAPPASAPTPPPVPEVAAGPASPTVDITGLPWDARIHAANRSTNQDGSWRQRRGLNDDALKNRIEAELRACVGASAGSTPAGSVASVAPPPAAPVVTPPAPPAAASMPTTSAPTAPAAPPAPASTPLPAPPAGETFGQFMARMAPQFAADGPASTARMTTALNANGLQTVGQLASRSDLIASVSATYAALGAAA